MTGRVDRLAPLGVAASFLVSGTVHLVRPQVFVPLIPPRLPAPRAFVYVSGVAELVCAAGLIARRGWAGNAATALLLAVWPGNLQMALDAGSGRNSGLTDSRVVTWARLPLQLPLIWAARRR